MDPNSKNNSNLSSSGASDKTVTQSQLERLFEELHGATILTDSTFTVVEHTNASEAGRADAVLQSEPAGRSTISQSQEEHAHEELGDNNHDRTASTSPTWTTASEGSVIHVDPSDFSEEEQLEEALEHPHLVPDASYLYLSSSSSVCDLDSELIEAYRHFTAKQYDKAHHFLNEFLRLLSGNDRDMLGHSLGPRKIVTYEGREIEVSNFVKDYQHYLESIAEKNALQSYSYALLLYIYAQAEGRLSYEEDPDLVRAVEEAATLAMAEKELALLEKFNILVLYKLVKHQCGIYDEEYRRLFMHYATHDSHETDEELEDKLSEALGHSGTASSAASASSAVAEMSAQRQETTQQQRANPPARQQMFQPPPAAPQPPQSAGVERRTQRSRRL